MTSGANAKIDLLLKLPSDLAKKLTERVNGADVSDYVAELIRADLERSSGATPGPEFAKAVAAASRFMDRYQNAYKELSK